MQNGFSYKEAAYLEPLTRVAFVYAIQAQKGAVVDWETGEITFNQDALQRP